ncbi:zinc knuckle domain protein [Talaromyces stipitatus ATCC 10500]|uniref:Zinc knuckle domain protein n=1 Tax=Talaromyces stipitatus (strain ATCC 10500 / CBS 375.48 / QM 6759 / NRRL 1006) TaxID=441959 RepID=B8MFB7_TALSN|nr:zinc knuckle domain protein [Talaromyces stipitatus ATCC 10500]EED16651.1 zinc knuckle domain protein [Talaromyces stipitatus ATCC 10500]
MAVPEGGPQTPENSARNEAISIAPGRRQNHPAETLQALVVEFPSLDNGKRITYQMVASLVSSLKKVITQQTNIIELARAEKELNCVRISTAQPEATDNNGNNNDNFTRFLPTNTANKHIRTALSNTESTKDVQVADVGTTKTGYIIRFRDAQSAETAQNNTAWLEELGNETRLVKPRFGIVVHRVPTEDFDLEKEKREGIEKIMEENDLAEKGFKIEDIAWLKKKDRPLGKATSMGIWLNTLEAAESIINNGLLVGQRYIGSVEPYKVKLKRCYHCQKFGYLAWSCKEQVKCSHCSGQHDQRNCPPGIRLRAGMEALINDHQSQNLNLLLIQEPSVTTYRTHVNHSAWQLYQPTYPNTDESTRYRSLIYFLIFLVYILPLDAYQATSTTAAEPILAEIKNTIEKYTKEPNKTTRLILAGDFNRHHPAWSHRPVSHVFTSQAEELINFFQTYKLQYLLGKASVLDLTLTNDPAKLMKCQLYWDNYGSDHCRTYSEWDLQLERNKNPKPKRAYDRADWDKIGSALLELLGQGPEISSAADLDYEVNRLVEATMTVLDQQVSLQKLSPYSKRWFTPELKSQQVIVNQVRRRWQSSCATLGSSHLITTSLFNDMCHKRREWTRTIKKKVATYMRPRDPYTNIPPLKVGSKEITENNAKAKVLLETFFPKMADPEIEDPVLPLEGIPWYPITELEVHRSLKAAKGTMAPGEDGIITLKMITYIFARLVELGHYPHQWKQARIIVLRKPGKPDYGKILEAVMACRLSFWAESYKLLPDTQFRGRPGRNTEQALLTLANAIDRAWLRSKVITLVAFNLTGAFNGVNNSSLDACLQAKGIPTIARRWIRSFIENSQSTTMAARQHLLTTIFDGEPEEDIPRIKAWARRTGSSFNVKKTELIHLIRSKRQHRVGQITINGTVIKPSDTVKLLGVIFDKEIWWKEHVQHLHPEQMRQIYQACVTPIVDYASTVWHNPLKDKIHLRTLGTVQRTTLICILSAFKTASTAALEVEAYVLPTNLRLKQRA